MCVFLPFNNCYDYKLAISLQQKMSLEQDVKETVTDGSPSPPDIPLTAGHIPQMLQGPNVQSDTQSNYKKHRPKPPTPLAPPTITTRRSESGSSTESVLSGLGSYDEPHGDESSARIVEESDCSDTSDTGYNVYMEDAVFDDTFLGEPDNTTIGIAHNLDKSVDHSVNGNFSHGFNFPMIDLHASHSDYDVIKCSSNSPKTKKITNRVVDQIKTEHRRYSLTFTPPNAPVDKDRSCVSHMSLEELKQKYYGHTSGISPNTHSGEVNHLYPSQDDLKEGSPNNMATTSRAY